MIAVLSKVMKMGVEHNGEGIAGHITYERVIGNYIPGLSRRSRSARVGKTTPPINDKQAAR